MSRIRRERYGQGYEAGKLDAILGRFVYEPWKYTRIYWKGYLDGHRDAESGYCRKGSR